MVDAALGTGLAGEAGRGLWSAGLYDADASEETFTCSGVLPWRVSRDGPTAHAFDATRLVLERDPATFTERLPKNAVRVPVGYAPASAKSLDGGRVF